jgi:hypothetical protein
VQVDRFPAALGVVLVLQTILDNLELQLSYGSHDAAAIELVDKQLCHTLVSSTSSNPFWNCLYYIWVVVLDIT